MKRKDEDKQEKMPKNRTKKEEDDKGEEGERDKEKHEDEEENTLQLDSTSSHPLALPYERLWVVVSWRGAI